MAILFAVGSALFAIGAFPLYAQGVGTEVDAATYFIGSLFFTAAAFLQYRESVDSGASEPPEARGRIFVFSRHQIDWWASAIQLVGTVYFNVSTGNALRVNLTATAEAQHVWRPDAVGSVAFLVASGLAWFELGDRWWTWMPNNLSWRITALNLVGSLAFGASAVAGFVVPATGQIRNAQLSDLGTFVGALCFLAGAVLLLPERTQSSQPATEPSVRR
jgi:hypothetical protein